MAAPRPWRRFPWWCLSSPDVRIRNAEDLRQAFRSSDLGVRLAVLRALAQDPTPAQKLQVDLVSLFRFTQEPQEALAWAQLLGKLANAEGPLLELLARASLSSIASEAARGLAPQREKLITPLGQMLSDPGTSPDRKPLIADLLVGLELDIELTWLVSLWTTAQVPPPRLEAATLEVWATHLDHPRALAWLEKDEAAGLLVKRWNSLSLASRHWLLALARRRSWPELAADLLGTDDEEAVTVALRLRPDLAPSWLDDARPGVRAAALLHAEAPEDWRARWERETDPRVRRALLATGSAGLSLEELVEQLQGDDWEMRAHAAQELARRPEARDALARLDDADPALIAALNRATPRR